MKSPQKENGYTAIANELLEAIARAEIPSRSLAILIIILRESYGWHRKRTEPMGYRLLAAKTGIHKSSVVKGVSYLISARIVAKDKDGSWAINKDHDAWVKAVRPSVPTGTPQRTPKEAQTVRPSVPPGTPQRTKGYAPAYPNGKEIKKELKITYSGAPAPQRKLTPSQFIIRAFKEAKGVAANDRDWDKKFAARYARSANDLLRAFEGKFEAAMFYLLMKGKEWDDAGLEDWGLEAVVNAAGREYEKVRRLIDGSDGAEMGADRVLDERGPRGATPAGALVLGALTALGRTAGIQQGQNPPAKNPGVDEKPSGGART